MFAPEGYVTHRFEQAGRESEKVFESYDSAKLMLAGFRLNELKEADPNNKFVRVDPNWEDHINNARENNLPVAVLFHCMLSKALMQLDTC